MDGIDGMDAKNKIIGLQKIREKGKIPACILLTAILFALMPGCTIHSENSSGFSGLSTQSEHSFTDSRSGSLSAPTTGNSSLPAGSDEGDPSSVPDPGSGSPTSGMEESFQAYSGSYTASIDSVTGYDVGLTGRNIFFTFDDGPSSVNTPQVLAILEKYHIKATFFICGPDTQASRDLIKQEFEAGHAIGIHCYSHNLTNLYQSETSFFADFDRVEAMITDSTGVKPSVYRFPGGTNNDFISKSLCDAIRTKLKERGYTYYDWNVSSYDSNNPPAADITATVIAQCEKRVGAANPTIILMHDSQSRTSTVEALEIILRKLIPSGYHFASLDRTVRPVQFVKR